MSRKYTYEGAVYAFDNLAARHWKASTWAVSEARAISNLKYRFRQSAGMVHHTPITFDGRLTVS